MTVSVATRFEFIDRFRGLVGVMMALGHAQYYANSAWNFFDPLDPTFDTWGQFGIRYMGYLCAPGFLVMNGAMVWWAWQRRVRKGAPAGRATWEIAQRALFLIAVQLVWVNASWSGFERLRLDHFGIIATIGAAMLLLLPLMRVGWKIRAGAAAAAAVGHAFLLRIPYDVDGPARFVMQLFVDAGDFNKYPVLPWFALACWGSVMAHWWFERWSTDRERAAKSAAIGAALIVAAMALRQWGGGFANIWPSGEFLSWSFVLVQKYPPSLTHEVWFAGAVTLMVGVVAWLGLWLRWSVAWLGVVGKVPLFFYAVHIPILAIPMKRFDLYYHRGGVLESFVTWGLLLAVMMPLAVWFAGVKRRNRSWLIRMI